MKKFLLLAIALVTLPMCAQAAGSQPSRPSVGTNRPPAAAPALRQPTPAARQNVIASHQSEQRISRQADTQRERTRDIQRDMDSKRK